MKPKFDYKNLKNIPFRECEVKENVETKELEIWHNGKLVLSDYNDVGDYMEKAILLFDKIKDKRPQWINLSNLWVLRDCIRENRNHNIKLGDLIFGKAAMTWEDDGYDFNKSIPMTKKRLLEIKRKIEEIDQYATIVVH